MSGRSQTCKQPMICVITDIDKELVSNFMSTFLPTINISQTAQEIIIELKLKGHRIYMLHFKAKPAGLNIKNVLMASLIFFWHARLSTKCRVPFQQTKWIKQAKNFPFNSDVHLQPYFIDFLSFLSFFFFNTLNLH